MLCRGMPPRHRSREGLLEEGSAVETAGSWCRSYPGRGRPVHTEGPRKQQQKRDIGRSKSLEHSGNYKLLNLTGAEDGQGQRSEELEKRKAGHVALLLPEESELCMEAGGSFMVGILE